MVALTPTLLRLWFRLTGRKHLLRLFNGVLGSGKPGAAMLPEELIDQALGLMLSGVGNTLAIHSNRQWIWPMWVERQLNHQVADFIPTGVNVLTTNLSHRNWTTIASRSASLEAMIDPVGMITPRAFGWSLLPYLRSNGELHAPPRLSQGVQQELTDHQPVGVETRYDTLKELPWKVTCHTIRDEKGEWLHWEIQAANASLESQTFEVGMAIRPYNMLTMGPIHHLEHRGSTWEINGKSILEVDPRPHRSNISDRQGGDPMVHQPSFSSSTMTSRSGMLSGTMEWKAELSAGEKDTWKGRVRIQSGGKFWGPPSENEVELSIDFPLEHHQRAFQDICRRFHVFDDGSFYTPGSFFYHEHWIRDSAFLMMADLNLGRFSRISEKIDHWMAGQSRSGVFNSQKGEWDSTGQVLALVTKASQRMGRPDLLNRHHRALERASKWVFRHRGRDENERHGLLPAGLSAEHFGPNDHYFWDNFWCLAGVEQWLEHAELSSTAHLRYQREALDYRKDLEKVMGLASKNLGEGALPCAPTRRFDSAAIGNLVAVSPLALFDHRDAWVRPTVERLFDEHVIEGLFFQDIIHTGFNPYLSLQLAMVMMGMHDARYVEILDAVIAAGGPTRAWPEAIHPHTKGGCMGDGDHGWVHAEVINIMRDMVVQEKGEDLHLAVGMQAQWFTEERSLVVRDAPVDGGRLSYSLESLDEHWNFQWSHTGDGPLILWEPLERGARERCHKKVFESEGRLQWRKANEMASHPI